MKSSSPNQYTGFRSTGFRFRFCVRSISHRSLFLPFDMQKIPEIKRLLAGESPLSVFNCHDIHDARRAFRELRKKFDFAYWAITEFFIRDMDDADLMVPLCLNGYQHYIIDTMQKLYQYRCNGRYVISKSFPRCGVTTCVQAYIIWMQKYVCTNNSYTCSSSDINILPLKTNLCRFLKRDIIPAEKWLYLPYADSRAFMNSFKSPNFVRGINIGYVHLADMSKWKDPTGSLSSDTFRASVSGVLLAHFTLVVLEGNIPKVERFNYRDWNRSYLPFDFRMELLRPFTNNPYFLNYTAALATDRGPSPYIHIDLDSIQDPMRRISIPYNPARFPS